jgi:hypothetical protein
MRPFARFLKLEFNRLLTNTTLIIAALFFALSMGLVKSGTEWYRDIPKDNEDFKVNQKIKAEGSLSYNQMGVNGFSVKYVPPPLIIFSYNSGLFSDLTAHINVNEKLEIHESIKGKNTFKERVALPLDFTGAMLFFGSLILIFYGCNTLRPREYLRDITGMWGRIKVYACLIASRFLLISLFFIFTAAAAVGLVLLEGIQLQGNHYVYLLRLMLIWEMTAFFAFLLGTLLGIIRNIPLGNLMVFLAWILFIFILPAVNSKVMKAKANNIPSTNKMEKVKLGELRNFEKRAIAKDGRLKKENAKSKSELEWIESFWKNEYKNIRAIEKELEKQMSEKIGLHQTLSAICPSAFFYSASAEQSGLGYESILEFFRYLQDLKHRFCQYYKEKKYYSDDKKVEPFIKDEELYLYYGESRVHGKFLNGIFIMLAQIIVLTILSYLSFKYALFHLSRDEIKKLNTRDLGLKKDKPNVLYSPDNLLAILLFCIFFGYYNKIVRKGFSREFRLPGFDINSPKKSHGVAYISSERFFPGEIGVNDYIALCAAMVRLPAGQEKEIFNIPGIQAIKNKRFNQLEIHEWGEVPLAVHLMRKSDVYLFFDTTLRVKGKIVLRFMEKLMELVDSGAAAVYVYTDRKVTFDQEETPDHYWEDEHWFDTFYKFLKNKYGKQDEK